MSYETLEIERAGGVATLWMNRPDKHNAFNAIVINELDHAFQALDADEMTRVIVLAGRGKSFSAGADLNWMKAAGEAGLDENLADAMKLATMLRTIAQCSKPTLARVHGAAFGGGLGLACICDICVAGARAVFATSEVKFGIIPAAIGERQAYRYCQSADRIDASRAAEIGIAHEAVTTEALNETVEKIVAALLEGGPKSQAAVMELIRAVAHQPVTDTVLADTARRIATLRSTPEAREGLSAFLDKRPAAWVA